MAQLNPFNSLRHLKQGFYYSLAALEEQGIGKISRLPICLRIILESLLRHCDEKRVKQSDVRQLAQWKSACPPQGEVPFIVARVLLQDFTGLPLLVDLAAMRDKVADLGLDPSIIEPKVPVDLVIDHSIQVDQAGTENAFDFNVQIEFLRNRERYEFLKWGQQSFKTFNVIPPSMGIVHQVNLEYLATVVITKKQQDGFLLYPDTLVGTDSHTPMINGLGIVGWGVGGIEAEAAMLGQIVSLQTPEVIGVHMRGQLKEGITATDLALHVTELLRQEKVVGKFIEFYGEGAASLTVADRATIANMAPEYGATIGFFPCDEKTLDYLALTGRSKEAIECIKNYLQAQHLFGISLPGEIDFTRVIELNLNSINPSLSGPKRPQDRLDLVQIKSFFKEILAASTLAGGYEKNLEAQASQVAIHPEGYTFLLPLPQESGGISEIGKKIATWSEEEMVVNRPLTKVMAPPCYAENLSFQTILTHGSIVIAAITSCTNTSNPSVMLGAGLLAKKAVEKGLTVNPMIKTSLAPGSRAVTEYLKKTGLQKYLDALGFYLVGYGCTTCIGNSGPLDERVEQAIKDHDLITVSVLSGNRNFEARIHSAVKANFLMSPPLVVAFALAGKIMIDVENEPLTYTKEGTAVFLRELWPSSKEIEEAFIKGVKPCLFKESYRQMLKGHPVWNTIITGKSSQYLWDSSSTYIRKPPYFKDFKLELPSFEPLQAMRALAVFADSVTTDHISPAGAFQIGSEAGKYLLAKGIKEEDFNSYGSRRGNHEVMIRGTFANVRLRNKMVKGKEGGYTLLIPEQKLVTVFEAAQIYKERKTSLIVFAGKDYGMGSSRDWAAKGTALLGVKVVVAQSFERIHRSNLIGMGVLPLEFQKGKSVEGELIQGDELFFIQGLEKGLKPRQTVNLLVQRGKAIEKVELISRLDTLLEVDYYQHGGILPCLLRQIIQQKED